MTDRFLGIASRKLNHLLAREDFVRIKIKTEKVITLIFNSGECEIDIYGRVIWLDIAA